MKLHRAMTSSFMALHQGKSVPLDLRPPQGHTLGLHIHDGCVYFYRDREAGRPTEDDVQRWKEATGQDRLP